MPPAMFFAPLCFAARCVLSKTVYGINEAENKVSIIPKPAIFDAIFIP